MTKADKTAEALIFIETVQDVVDRILRKHGQIPVENPDYFIEWPEEKIRPEATSIQ